MIQIEEILVPERILMDLAASGKAEGFERMLERLAALGRVRDAAGVRRLLVERERLMTTGVKRGFAFPHAFSDEFDESFLSIGVFREGLAYAALDGQPVEFVFLLLGPPSHRPVHLQILARVSRLTGQPEMLEAMRGAGDAGAIMELLIDTERRVTAYPFKTAGAE
jgi:mannitol/fructose-specific phosphotransferase system IIA component (Ntr-type)